MESSKDFYKSICRVCLSSDNSKTMVSLFENSSDDGLTCYGKAVMTFANIILKKDSLPRYMCQKCLFLLKQAIIFKKMCESTHQTLSDLVQRSDDSDSKIEEIVTEYVMFMHYFSDGNFKSDSNQSTDKKIDSNSDNDLSNCKNVQIKQIKMEENFDAKIEDVCDDLDFHDTFQNDTTSENEENNSNSNNVAQEQDVDNLLNDIEKIIEIDPKILNGFGKKYINKSVRHRRDCRKRTQFPNMMPLESKAKTQYIRRDGIVEKRRDIQCKICNKVLANTVTYKCHMQLHTGGRFVCELCGKSFSAKAQLQGHQAAIHGVGRFFVCKQCGFKAARKFDLTEHERFHSGERPFACDKCGMTFRRRFIWKKHELYHMEKTVQCPKCPRKFYQRGAMLSHANNVHERVYVYACHKCQVTYAKPSTVRRHLVDKHGIPREKQGKIVRINFGKQSVDKLS